MVRYREVAGSNRSNSENRKPGLRIDVREDYPSFASSKTCLDLSNNAVWRQDATVTVTVEHLPRDRGRQSQVLFARLHKREDSFTENGHIDGIFASADVGNLMEPFGTVTAESFDATFICRMFAARWSLRKKHWRFCAITRRSYETARSAGRGFPAITVCVASKAPLRSFPRTWTSALQDRKIRVNVLNSGGITTAAQDFLPPGAPEIYAESGSLREAKMVTVPGINHLTWCMGRRLRNDGHSLPVL
jgi:Dehydrogenases with different specificities (related to short-chain alcohol dehydrogenases)